VIARLPTATNPRLPTPVTCHSIGTSLAEHKFSRNTEGYTHFSATLYYWRRPVTCCTCTLLSETCINFNNE
jgi:hypothetical protein